MSTAITLPLWVFVALLALAAWAALERLLLPSLRWYLRRRVNRIIDELNTRLQLRIDPFRLTKRQVLIERLTFDPEVVQAAHAYAEEHAISQSEVMVSVARYAREIVPAFNAYTYFRVGYWAARQIARALYRVRLGYADDEGLSRVPSTASVVFVMNHRSNMDYILVAYLIADRAALSYAVGEWARVWPLQSLVRSLGAYFVRRNASNPVYRKVLSRYVHMATRGGVVQAVYPEGGLSVDGGLRTVKMGLLSYVLNAFDDTSERDIVFIPVGINYDRVLEDRSQLRKLDRGAAPRTPAFVGWTIARFALRNLWLVITRRWYRLGYAGVGLGTPFSVKDHCAAQGVDLASMSTADRFAEVERISGAIMDRVKAMIPVLPVSLVATVFAHGGDDALSELELKVRASALIARLEERGAHVYMPRADRDYSVAVGLRMLVLRGAVFEEAGLYRTRPRERDLLHYYANSIRHFLEGGDR